VRRRGFPGNACRLRDWIGHVDRGPPIAPSRRPRRPSSPAGTAPPGRSHREAAMQLPAPIGLPTSRAAGSAPPTEQTAYTATRRTTTRGRRPFDTYRRRLVDLLPAAVAATSCSTSAAAPGCASSRSAGRVGDEGRDRRHRRLAGHARRWLRRAVADRGWSNVVLVPGIRWRTRCCRRRGPRPVLRHARRAAVRRRAGQRARPRPGRRDHVAATGGKWAPPWASR
jgi:hypothetical protein